jgi:Uri superfamily endonuclease
MFTSLGYSLCAMVQRRDPSKTPGVVFVPRLDRWPDTGVYQLHIHVRRAIHVQVGRLGRFSFPPDRYVYTGRASRGLRARVQRHVNGACKRHWHIDHLLARREVEIVRVELASTDAREECEINAATVGETPAPGFGASDCAACCGAHLKRVSGRVYH